MSIHEQGTSDFQIGQAPASEEPVTVNILPKGADELSPEQSPENKPVAENMLPSDQTQGQVGEPSPTTPVTQDPASQQVQPEPQTAQNAAQILQNQGLDLAPFMQEFTENGQLGDESYKALEGAGFDRGLVDTYIEGRQAILDRQDTQVTSLSQQLAGGEAEFQSVQQWAATNVAQEVLAQYNDDVGSMDLGRAENAVRSLIHRYQTAQGNEGAQLDGNSVHNDQGSIYEDRSQMMADMRDPQYHESPAFRAAVARKAERSIKKNGGFFS